MFALKSKHITKLVRKGKHHRVIASIHKDQVKIAHQIEKKIPGIYLRFETGDLKSNFIPVVVDSEANYLLTSAMFWSMVLVRGN